MTLQKRDHGGGIDAAIAHWGGSRGGWLDLSTGLNPLPYPVENLPRTVWQALPDAVLTAQLETHARAFWDIPDDLHVIAAPGASALIARMPALWPKGTVGIHGPTYNEHAAAFAGAGWTVTEKTDAPVRVIVHPNNPDGRLWQIADLDGTRGAVIDESFCDTMPARSLIGAASRPGTVVLKSFGKFWGLGGLRLGFAIGRADVIDPLDAMLGPWPVSGPALWLGAQALGDFGWANSTRARLQSDAARLDALMAVHGARVAGGTTLFRLYEVDNARDWHDRLARAHILTRTFPYSDRWLRLGLPGTPSAWNRLAAAL